MSTLREDACKCYRGLLAYRALLEKGFCISIQELLNILLRTVLNSFLESCWANSFIAKSKNI